MASNLHGKGIFFSSCKLNSNAGLSLPENINTFLAFIYKTELSDKKTYLGAVEGENFSYYFGH